MLVPGFRLCSANISIFMRYFQEITKASSEGEFVLLKRGESKYVFLHLCARMSNPSPPMNHFPPRHRRVYNRTVLMGGNGRPSKSHYETGNSRGTKHKFCLDCSLSMLGFFFFLVNPNVVSPQQTQLYPSALQCLFLSLLGASYKRVIISSIQLSVFIFFHSRVP